MAARSAAIALCSSIYLFIRISKPCTNKPFRYFMNSIIWIIIFFLVYLVEFISHRFTIRIRMGQFISFAFYIEMKA